MCRLARCVSMAHLSNGDVFFEQTTHSMRSVFIDGDLLSFLNGPFGHRRRMLTSEHVLSTP
jgi:hypothetical protein